MTTSTTSEKKDELPVNLITVGIPKDELTAELKFAAIPADGIKPTFRNAWYGAEAALKEAGVSFGIDYSKMHDLLIEWTSDGLEKRGVVALGARQQDGCDTQFEVIFKLPETIKGGKREDHRELGAPINIVKGVILARSIPHTIGLPGMTVKKMAIPQKPGKQRTIEKTEFVSAALQEDGSTLYESAIDGVLILLGDFKVKVVNNLIIAGDLDYKVGNIDAWAAVTIKGSIKPHFTVKSTSEITVAHEIESSCADARTNVVARGGIIGKEGATLVMAGGDISCKFAEHAELLAGGSVKVNESIVGCKISARRDVEVRSRNGSILTSTILAGGSVSCGSAGSKAEGRLSISVGHDPAIWLRVITLKHDLQHLQRIIKKSSIAKIMRKQNSLQRKVQTRRSDKHRTALIYERVLKHAVKNVIASLSALGMEPCVKITNKLFAGTKIIIGPYNNIFKETTDGGKFILNSNNQRIQKSK